MAEAKFPGASAESCLDSVRADALFTACRLRHLLDLAGGELADPRDDELLGEALTQFVQAVDAYEAQADRVTRKVLGAHGIAARRWGQ
jgi:hypothetical protein